MPPVDPTVRLTPWWVRHTVRVAELISGGKYLSLSEKDQILFREAIETISGAINE